MRIAFVVSWLNQYGGAERVLEAAHELFPQAPVYTSILDRNALPAFYRTWDVRVSFMDRLPGVHRRHQYYLPFYPKAFESFDLRAYDLVLSVPSAFAQGVRTSSPTRHLCYCLTPARFLWLYEDYVRNEAIGPALRAVLPLAVKPLKQWDRAAAQRVHEYVAISTAIRSRIARFYGRESIIIYPPVSTADFHPAPAEEVADYFLIVSRLVPYKRVDLAVEAFTRLKLPLVIAGDGRDRARLEKMAGPNVRFLGRISDQNRRQLMARCRAFVFPGEEDFGIAPLEANASGRPVIAYGGGGALDTVVDGVTGVLFREPTAESLSQAVASFDDRAFDARRLAGHASNYDVQVFKDRLCEQIDRLMGTTQWN